MVLFLAMTALVVAQVGGMGGITNGAGGCDPLPPIAISSMKVATPGSASLDLSHARLIVDAPLLEPRFQALVSGGGTQVLTGVLHAAFGTPGGAVHGYQETREVELPALKPHTRYDVALRYARPTPEGCEPPPPTFVGAFVTP